MFKFLNSSLARPLTNELRQQLQVSRARFTNRGSKGNSTVQGYARGISTYHWLMAGGILSCFAFVELSKRTPKENPVKWQLLGYHKSVGLIMMALIIGRFARRFIFIDRLKHLPSESMPGPSWQHLAASVSHYTLYGMMIAMPTSGIIMSYWGGYGIGFFNLFKIPGKEPANKEIAGKAYKIHSTVGTAIEALVAVHISAALFHQFQGHQPFSRINPFAAAPLLFGSMENGLIVDDDIDELLDVNNNNNNDNNNSDGKKWTDDM